MLKQMRANLKTRIVELVDEMGAKIIPNFDKTRLVQNDDAPSRKSIQKQESDLMIDGRPMSYYHEIELNNLFETLNISYQYIREYMEGLQDELLI